MATPEIEKLLTTLGLCARARKLVFGTDQICEAMRAGKKMPYLVIEACDTSENTHKRLTDRCRFYGVEHVRIECDTLELAHAVGKLSAMSAVAITDEGLCRAVKTKLEKTNNN